MLEVEGGRWEGEWRKVKEDDGRERCWKVKKDDWSERCWKVNKDDGRGVLEGEGG